MGEEMKVPGHWKVRKLGEIGTYINGKAFKPTEWSSRGLPIIRIQNLNSEDSEYNYCNFPVENKYYVNKGDLLFAWSGTPGTSFGAHIWKGDKAVLNQHIFKIIIDEELIQKRYYLHALNHKVHEFINKAHGAAGLAHITKKKFEESQIPLPPLPEQRAIVAKIEELLSDLENGKQQLLTAQQQLKVYRQSLMKVAFEGRFGYAQRPPNSVRDGELPKGWKRIVLNDVAEMCLGKMLDKNKNKGIYQYYLRNISVRWGCFDLDDLEQMRFEETEDERYGLIKGDLVVCEGGEPGRCAIWKGLVPKMKIQKALHRVRVNKCLSGEYLYHFMLYSGMSGLLEKYFTGTTIKHLTGSGLKKIEIPLPPIDEQHHIVSILESKLTVCDNISATITQSLAQAETLRQSILKKAFEGKLITDHDSHDLLDKHDSKTEQSNTPIKRNQGADKKKGKKKVTA